MQQRQFQGFAFHLAGKLALVGMFVLFSVIAFHSADAQQGAAPLSGQGNAAAPAQARTDGFDMQVREDFFAGMTGNQARLDKGMKFCEAMLAKQPQHPEALVWHGAGLMYQSGRSFQAGDMQTGMEMWQRGLQEMETAVNLAPANVAVLIPRAACLNEMSKYIPVPEMADELLTIAVNDYEVVYKLQQPYLAKLTPHARGELLTALATGWHRLGQEAKARPYFELLAKEPAGTTYITTAQTWLEKKTLPAKITCAGCHV
jgi:hypothetical protein